MESDIFVRIAIDEVKEHGTGENSRIDDPENKKGVLTLQSAHSPSQRGPRDR